MTDFRLLHIFSFGKINKRFVCSLESVADDDVTAGDKRIKAVQESRIKMIKRILAESRIQRVAVRKERTAAEFLHKISHRARIIRPQICKIPRLAEMHLDSREFTVKINIPDACRLHETCQFLRKILVE